jgi:hypothetical protein
MAYQNSGSWPKNLLQKPLKSNEPGLPPGLARGGEPLVYFYKRTQRYLKAIQLERQREYGILVSSYGEESCAINR